MLFFVVFPTYLHLINEKNHAKQASRIGSVKPTGSYSLIARIVLFVWFSEIVPIAWIVLKMIERIIFTASHLPTLLKIKLSSRSYIIRHALSICLQYKLAYLSKEYGGSRHMLPCKEQDINSFVQSARVQGYVIIMQSTRTQGHARSCKAQMMHAAARLHWYEHAKQQSEAGHGFRQLLPRLAANFSHLTSSSFVLAQMRTSSSLHNAQMPSGLPKPKRHRFCTKSSSLTAFTKRKRHSPHTKFKCPPNRTKPNVIRLHKDQTSFSLH